MLPRSPLLTLFFLLPDFSYGFLVPFASHSQLNPQQPLVGQNLGSSVQFTPSSSYLLPATPVILKSRPITVFRPRSLDVLHRTRLRSLRHSESELEQLVWDLVKVEGPDVGDLHTLAQLARMSANAYALPGQKNWYEVDQAWNTVSHQHSMLRICCLSSTFIRAFRLAGKSLMASGVTFFNRPITPPSYCRSRAQHYKEQLRNWTNSTTTCGFLLT